MLSKQRRSMIFATLIALLVFSPVVAGLFGRESPPSPTQTFFVAQLEITHPADMVFENGSLGKQIVWNVTTENPKNFTVTRDGDVYDSGSYDGGLIVVDLNHLYEENLTKTLPVTFTFVCTVFDMSDESISDSVQVQVIADVLAPIIVPTIDSVYGATNASYEVGSFGHTITWNITESNPSTFNVTRWSNETTSNFTVLEAGAWSGNNITISIDGLNATHIYIYTLFVNDTLGYNSTSSVNITVYEDLTAPVISHPADIEYEFGSTGHDIVWYTYDSNPLTYTFRAIVHYTNTTYGNVSALVGTPPNQTDVSWSFTNPKGLNLTFSVDKMYLGNYTFSLTLYDDYGHNSTDSVNVTVYKDLRAPVVDGVHTFDYEEGYTGYSLNWSADESNPRSYNLTRGNEILMNGTWRGENLSISIDGLAVGEYIYNMTLNDYFNQSTSFLTNVTVTPDAHPPLIENVIVVESYTTVTTNNISIQAYVWDLNNISSVKVEWKLNDNVTVVTKDMDLFGNDIYVAQLGQFAHGDIIHYRVSAMDNSSVHNVELTPWTDYTVESMNPVTVPLLVWGGVLALGILASIALLWIYTKTKTR
jgi:hypothetical protein